MALNFLLNQVKNAIFNDPTTPHKPGYDPSGLIGQLEGMFGNFGQQHEVAPRGQVLPASQDPLGDPGDQQGTYAYADRTGLPPNVRPASQDPLGDPADQGGGGFGNVRPASEDPLGDPADQS